MEDWNNQIIESYDKTAQLYADTFFHELEKKPFDCEILKNFAKRFTQQHTIYDLGCGPGHVTRHLHEYGMNIIGLDLSDKMIEIAKSLNPHIDFIQGDLNDLKFDDSSIDGFIAFYSFIHISRVMISDVLSTCFNALKPKGLLLMSFHGGDGDIHVDEFLGETVSVDATLYQAEEMKNVLIDIGFHIEFVKNREPYDFEFQKEKIYIQCLKEAMIFC